MEEQELTQEDLDKAMEGRMGNPLKNGDTGEENMTPEGNDTAMPEEEQQVQEQRIQEEQNQVPQAAQENLKGSDRIFPGGPTHNQVENWKQEYDDIYMTEFESQTYIWRTLSRLEYKELMNSVGQSDWEGEELVAQTCVLWPENYGPEEISNGKAGVPSILSDQIMAKSGFAAQSRAQKL